MGLAKRALQLARPELLRTGMLINGEWRTGASTFKVYDPATQGELAEVAEATRQDTKDAIDAAHRAFSEFGRTTARYRSDLLRRWAELVRANADDLGKIVSSENGKPFAEAKGEVLQSAQNFEWFSEAAPHYNGDTIPSANADVRIHTIRQPVGVCGIITPWNFPAAMIARKVGAALGAGCTTVIKPAEDTPLTALAFMSLAHEAGVPAGVVNVVPTRTNVADVGAELTESHKVRKITFTGSTGVGKFLMRAAADTVKKVSFELGGNAPFIVFDDADVDKAVAGAMASKFRGSGQTCVCANRIFVQDGIYDEFVSKLGAAVAALQPGHGLDAGTTQGPLINEKSLAKVQDHVADALAAGKGSLVEGGAVIGELGPLFFAPTVIRDVDPTAAKVFSEETFGPLAAVARFRSDEEVVEWANATEAGLAGYFFTNTVSRAYKIAEALEVGMVGINTGLITEVALPFGGIKESGFGREMSVYGLDDYTVIKSIVTNIA